jgi:hypothetical protein
MKEKMYLFVLVLVAALGLSLFWNYKQYRDYKEQPTIIKERVVVQYVEKKDTMPTAKEEIAVGVVKVPVKKVKTSAKVIQKDYVVQDVLGDSVPLADNATDVQDSVEIELTQKVYSDSTYTAYVSGYKPNLDSIFIRQRYVTNTRIEERVVKEKAFRRLNFGITVGFGYGFQSKTFEPFAGVGITYYPFK